MEGVRKKKARASRVGGGGYIKGQSPFQGWGKKKNHVFKRKSKRKH